jgi:chromate transport protein ChrA
MKKYVYFYAMIFIITITLILSKGILLGVIVNTYDDYKDYGIVDGFSGKVELLTYNSIIALAIIISSIYFTFKRDNNIKIKIFILLGIFILLLFIPIGINYYSGGFAGITGQKILLLKDINMMFR